VGYLVIFKGESHVVSHEQIEVAITVNIDKASARAHLISGGDARGPGHIGKSAIAIVPIKDIRPKVVQVDVRVAVTIVIAGADAEVVVGVNESGGESDVREFPPAVIAI
jgi:hypothetical protein